MGFLLEKYISIENELFLTENELISIGNNLF